MTGHDRLGPLGDPNIFEGHDVLHPRSAEDYCRQAAASMMAIAEMQRDELTRTGETVDNSTYFADPTGKVVKGAPVPVDGWGIVYRHDLDLGTDHEVEQVAVKKYPPFPEFDSESLTAQKAAGIVERHERAKARAPEFRWDELHPERVRVFYGGIEVDLSPDDAGMAVTAARTVREAAIVTAAKLGRHDVLQQLLPAEEV